MTIDFTTPCETKSFIRPSDGTFYPAKIPRQHSQLKNHISTKTPNIVYYASNNEIFALNLATQKRKCVKSLFFKPCCLDAAHGWICVGGPDGQCGFIRIDEGGAGGATSSQPFEVDGLLPLDLDPEYRQPFSTSRQSSQWARSPIRRTPKYELQTHEFGEDIVNSVTISVLSSGQKGFKDEIVVIMTDNEKTVRIFSLSQCRMLGTLDFPEPMNHATISPDGKLMLAVGDEARAFFCERIQLPTATLNGEETYARYEWQEIAEPKLTLADQEEDACFTTAFSPSGHMCAVASQSGVVTVFSTALIHSEMDPNDAVIAVLKSSRAAIPRNWIGGVRAMSFSPAPWDLLSWAEDQGRACVVDLRNKFNSRQTIELETDSPDMNRAEIDDHEFTSEQRQMEIERRFIERHREALEAQGRQSLVSQSTDYIELAAEQRRIEREALDALSRDGGHSLTESERQMIDSIGLRRMPNAPDNPSTGPISINYPPSRNTESQQWIGGLPSPLPSSNVPSRSTASIHDFISQRNFERSRTSTDAIYQPRRRSSVVISNSNSNSNTSSPHPSSNLAPIDTTTPTLSTSPSRLPTNTAIDSHSTIPDFDSQDSWQTIGNAMRASDMSSATLARMRARQAERMQTLNSRMQHIRSSQAASNAQVQSLDRISQQMTGAYADTPEERVRRARDANARAMRRRADVLHDELPEPRRRMREEDGPVTMGIAWDVDGRNLYVATEEGILEYPVNIEERKLSSGISFL